MSQLSRRSSFTCAAILLPLWLPSLGCNPNDPMPGGPGAGFGAPLTPEQRNAAIDAISDHFESLALDSRTAENEEMLRFIQGRPEFRAARITKSGTIAARFSDGPGFVFFNNLDDVGDDPDEKDGDKRIKFAAAQIKPGLQLPESDKVVLLNGFSLVPLVGGGNPVTQFYNERSAAAHIDVIGNMFVAQQYDVIKDYAGLERLRNDIKDTDVLYFIGHGGLGLDELDNEIYVINTSEGYSLLAELYYQDDIAANRIGYAIHTGTLEGIGPRQRRTKAAFYITPKFISHYMSFNKYSLVFINGCASAAADKSAIRDAFIAGGTSAYVGWDDKVNAGDVRDTAEYFYDRLLGAQLSKVAGVRRSPPVRPFPQALVVNEMQHRQRSDKPFLMSQSHDTAEAASQLANLAVQVRDSDPDYFGILAPTIQSLSPEPDGSSLRLNGSFGSFEGRVTIGGEEVPVTSWAPSAVACDLTAHPDVHGDVVAEVRGHASNAVPLTFWTGTVTMNYYNYGTLQQSATINARIRAGLMETRSTPDGEPGGTSGPRQRGFFGLSWNSTAQITATGSWSPTDNDDRSWSLNGPSQLSLPLSTGQSFGLGSGEIDLKQRLFPLAPTAILDNGLAITVTQSGTSSTTYDVFSLSGDQISLSKRTLQMDANYNIPGGSAEAPGPDTGFGPTRYTLEWTAMSAQDPPTNEHAR